MKGAHAAVVGLGESGFACARYLTRLGARVSILDDAPWPKLASRAKRELPASSFHFGGLDEQVLSRQDEIFVSPGVAVQRSEFSCARQLGIRLSGDVDLFARERRRLCPEVPLLAVTGTNGKSTVTAWLSHALCRLGIRARAGGNIGRPVLELLDTQAECFVVELSSFQLESVHDLFATVACILNVSPDHLDRYPDFAGYQAAKMRILSSCSKTLANRDEPGVSVPADFSFGFSEPAGDSEFGLCGDEICLGERRLAKASDLPLVGRHNLSNAMAVLAFLTAAGQDPGAAAASLQQFDGLPHRCRLVRSLNAGGRQLRFINDSKATNVGATVAALEGLQGQGCICLLAGGQGKSADFSPLASALAGSSAVVLLFGEDADLIAEALGSGVRWELTRDLTRAFKRALALGSEESSESGDWLILLSPACASFDSFQNYADRGECFEHLALALDEEVLP